MEVTFVHMERAALVRLSATCPTEVAMREVEKPAKTGNHFRRVL